MLKDKQEQIVYRSEAIDNRQIYNEAEQNKQTENHNECQQSKRGQFCLIYIVK